MGKEQKLLQKNHTATSRDYLSRVVGVDKAKACEIAKRFDKDYWDGDRSTGYGGYRDDGRWAKFAQDLIQIYSLTPKSSVLDIGCGKAFLLKELSATLPGITVRGIDISSYALENAPAEVKPHLRLGSAIKLPYEDHEFDLVISLNTLHNLKIDGLYAALSEISRVQKKNAYLCVESYQTEQEKLNLMHWQLTCESFYSPEEWKWIFSKTKYSGDYEFIYFK